MKNSQQLNDLIRNKATVLGISPQILLRRYFMEKFLERISKSKYNENFILKGGVLVSSLVGLNIRTTQDVDLLVKDFPFTDDSIVKLLTEISQIDNQDSIVFTFEKTKQIMEGLDYPGIRVFFNVEMDRTREKIHLDISTGDKITPKEIMFGYKLLLEDKNIGLYAYTIETVLAEKIETILIRHTTNTRARDYYDCYVLEKLFSQKIDYSVLGLAINNTVERRNSGKALENAHNILVGVGNDYGQKGLWELYQKKNPTDGKIEFVQIIETIRRLLRKAGILHG